MNLKRVCKLNNLEVSNNGPILYWMSRDQRVSDNWALIFAYNQSKSLNQPLFVIFNFVENFLGATERQYDFMIEGLKEVEEDLKDLNIPFFIEFGDPTNTIPSFMEKNNISMLITDFSPLKVSRKWKNEVKKKIKAPFYEVDTHNIVPIWVASQKLEFAARTIRPKINVNLNEFLTDFPKLKPLESTNQISKINWEHIKEKAISDKSVKKVKWIRSGTKNANKTLELFIEEKLEKYNENRNDPSKNFQSNLSPFFHFGQISSQRVAWEINKTKGISSEKKEQFLEELIIRKELSDNFCFYNQNYDKFEGFPNWAKETLNKHKNDVREIEYSLSDFENAKTHEKLWNAAQNEMVKTGKMHGYLRMYWAKKILEWSKSAEEALEIAIYLNDKYELDGRDPNGYTGIAWSIGGVHDRPWFDRPIYGSIRYMSESGARNKFDIDAYIDFVSKL